MAKRKAAVKQETPDSDLSLPPDGLLDSDHEFNPPVSKKRRLKVEESAEISTNRRGTTTQTRVREAVKVEVSSPRNTTPKRKRTVKEEITVVEGEISTQDSPAQTKPKRASQKEKKAAEAMPLAPRTLGHKLFIGAHVSSAGGVHNSPANSVHIGANAFALFLKSQRKWANPPLAEDHCLSFHGNCKEHKYDQGSHVVPHGSYLVNLAHTDKDRTDQAYESYLDDLRRCEKLGIRRYNIHPGNTVSNDRQKAIAHLASNINRAHKETSTVVTLLENMAAGGNVLGSTFEDLRDTIALVDDKSRIGVCIDTCHAFAAGYDLRSPAAFKATMDQFEEIVGFQYLRAMHLNDSKAPFDSRRDLHANIGTGFLGLRAFHNVVNEPRFIGLPLILETPIDLTDEYGTPLKDDKGKVKEDKANWAKEIKLLESLVGMDTASDTFLQLEKDLARKGEPERARLAEQQERKREKEAKKAQGGGRKKAKATKAEPTETSDSE